MINIVWDFFHFIFYFANFLVRRTLQYVRSEICLGHKFEGFFLMVFHLQRIIKGHGTDSQE